MRLLVGKCISGVMVIILALSVVDRDFEPRSGQAKDCKISTCCFSTKQVVIINKCKDLESG